MGVSYETVVELRTSLVEDGVVVQGFDDGKHIGAYHLKAAVLVVGGVVVASGEDTVQGTQLGSRGLHQDGAGVGAELKVRAFGHASHLFGILAGEVATVDDVADFAQQAEGLLLNGRGDDVRGAAILGSLDFGQLALQVATLSDEVVLFLLLFGGQLALLLLGDGGELLQADVDCVHSCLDV